MSENEPTAAVVQTGAVHVYRESEALRAACDERAGHAGLRGDLTNHLLRLLSH
ncbi:hypothetical protein [Lentzea sp. NPDC003310]|uniref:hypothetical protein n=1 Tax=Lentzea sp. NPDC003310 TaxID=3154447 RepID=UPI0033A4B244